MAPLIKLCAAFLIVFTGLTFYQRLDMECNVARKNSKHFERAYNEAQDEVAEWRRKYDAEAWRADECKRNMTMELQLISATAQLAVAQRQKQTVQDEIIKSNAELPK